MVYWGKVFGGMAGFAMGGPFGAAIGAALGHAADTGVAAGLSFPFGPSTGSFAAQVKVAALLGRKEQVFSMAVVILAAKLAKCDGPVKRAEIEMFRRQFRIPDENLRDIGRLFDMARESADGYESYATLLGETFADKPETLEVVMTALFAIARADGAVTAKEHAFLTAVHHALRLDRAAWDRASGAAPARPAPDEPDPYDILGVPRSASTEELRTAWLNLMRQNHPDALVARGAQPAYIEQATASVARINAAWDRIKRERRL